MRRVIATFLTLVMMISVFSTFSLSASALEVTKESDRYYVTTSGMKDGKITFTIYLKANQSIETGMVSVKFDNKVFAPVQDDYNGAAMNGSGDDATQIVSGEYVAGVPDSTYNAPNFYTIAYMTMRDGGFKIGSKDKAFMTVTLKRISNDVNKTTSIQFFAGDYTSKDEIQNYTNFSVIDQPQITSVKSGKTGIEFTWNHAANANGYSLYKKNGETFEFIMTWSGVTSFVDTDVKDGQTYTYKICSRNQNGAIGLGEEFTFTYVEPKTVLSIPKVKSAVTYDGVNVTWNAVEDAESYIVYRKDYSVSKNPKWTEIVKNVTGTSYVDKTVKLGVTYEYTVRAVSGDVMSAYETAGKIKFDVKPNIKIANASNGIKVSWNLVANATGYTVYRSEVKNGKWTSWSNRGTAKAGVSSWTDKKVTSGKQYKYTVRAKNGSFGSSYKSSNVTIFLSQPTVKWANASNGIKVNWTKVNGSKGYTVYRSELVDGKWNGWKNMGTAKANKSSWVDKSVVSGVTYRYTARAINGSYKSTYQNKYSLMFLAQPAVAVKAVSTGIQVSWSQCDGATGYTVYRSEYNAKTKKWTSWSNRGTAASAKSSWVDKKTTKGKTYKYTVRAINKDAGVKSTYVASKSVKR